MLYVVVCIYPKLLLGSCTLKLNYFCSYSIADFLPSLLGKTDVVFFVKFDYIFGIKGVDGSLLGPTLLAAYIYIGTEMSSIF